MDLKYEITVKMLHFVQRKEKTKKGKMVKRLNAESVHANITCMLNFIEQMLQNDHMNIDIVMNIENITLPVNREQHSLH